MYIHGKCKCFCHVYAGLENGEQILKKTENFSSNISVPIDFEYRGQVLSIESCCRDLYNKTSNIYKKIENFSNDIKNRIGEVKTSVSSIEDTDITHAKIEYKYDTVSSNKFEHKESIIRDYNANSNIIDLNSLFD